MYKTKTNYYEKWQYNMKDHLEIKTTVAKIKNPIKEFKNQIERNIKNVELKYKKRITPSAGKNVE